MQNIIGIFFFFLFAFLSVEGSDVQILAAEVQRTSKKH